MPSALAARARVWVSRVPSEASVANSPLPGPAPSTAGAHPYRWFPREIGEQGAEPEETRKIVAE